MRSVHEWFDKYSHDHRNQANRLIHWICVPLILWAAIAALWVIPVPTWLGRPGFWAGMAMVAALAFYMRLSRPVGIAMIVVFVALAVLTEVLYRQLGANTLLWLAVAVFIVAWIGQFIGHVLEGARPSFFTDLVYLLIGPAWLASKIMRRLSIAF